MDDVRYKILTDNPSEDFLISRFPHEYEESFLDFVAKQYKAKEIIRIDDGVIVWVRK
jgi:hypothetical protein